MSKDKPAKAQKDANDFRRFIEESFPVKEVGAASSKEKNIRHGHISTLHIWWARRPLAASRATAYAALTPYPATEEERENKKQFIIDLCQWENSNNQALLERARREILDANGGVPPKVLDPFAGGGSYPLEALRLGCEAYANDYNPVAVLLEKATLEYPQKFGRAFENMPEWAKSKGLGDRGTGKSERTKKDKETQAALFESSIDSKSANPLLNAVCYWGEWVLEETRKELAEFYPSDPDGSIPVGYIWARTIPCQNPACGQDIPLMRQYWILKKDRKKVALYPLVQRGKIEFSIVGNGYMPWPDGFDADQGTISNAVVICPACGTTIDGNTNRKLFKDNKSGQKMLAIVLRRSNEQGKHYRLPSLEDKLLFADVSIVLEKRRQELMANWGIDPIPDELISQTMPGGFHTPTYGMVTWGSIFNQRQLLAMITFTAKMRDAYKIFLSDCKDPKFAEGIATYLAIVIDRLADYCSSLAVWVPAGEFIAHTFGRQALPMVWDYFELNPFSDATGDWHSALNWVTRVIEHLCDGAAGNRKESQITQGTATQLPYADNYFDAILTDPPYYYSVTYADLSDFFYVWLKRTLGQVFPDLFSTPLTPKQNEIIEKQFWDKTSHQDSEWYEKTLGSALKECNRVLKNNGVAIVVYAHKTTSGWETLLNALLDSNLVVSGSWPINTERTTRLMANESAALASSIYIVARKTSRQPTGFYNDVRTELRKHLDTKLHRLWEEGIGGADFFIAAIGSAIEVFGRYEQVMDYEGNIVRADRLLEEVRTIATDYAVRQILHNGFAAEISGLTRLYVLWRWNYGEALVPFDEARKLGQSCGIDISEAWSKTGVIRKEKEFVRMLGPQGRKLDDLDDPHDLIDVLHKSLLLWEKGQRAEMVQALAEKGHGKSEAFYRVAQAISETLPLESKEKKLLDGFLAGRERVQEEVEKVAKQERLFK